MDESQLSRREFFRLVGAGAFTLYLQGCSSLPRNPVRVPASDDFLRAWGPVDRTLGDGSTDDFSGDHFPRPHAVLWDLARFFSEVPIPSAEAEVPVVVVGGGIAGLLSAYELRAYQPVVLEQADRFGGNAKAESWNGIDYSLGAAYFCEAEAGSALDRLYRELGLIDHYRVKTREDPVALKGKFYDGYWKAQASPHDAVAIRKMAGYLEDCLNERNGARYPTIPSPDAAARRVVDELDHHDFLTHLTQRLGHSLPDSMRTVVEHYCWSSFGGSAAEVSAAAGINFLADEFGRIGVAPGGNAGVAERVLQKTLETVSPANFRGRSLVVKVSVDNQGALVVYQSADGKLHCLRARAVVMACPKFVAARILDGIESARQRAISQLSYRSYLVANVLLRRPSGREFYDLFLLGDGHQALRPPKAAATRQGATDVVLANFAAPSRRAAVLTLYRALPYEGARAELLLPTAHEHYRREFETQIAETILPLLGFRPEDVAGLRLTRWAHPLPLARAGIYRSGLVDRLRQPFRERVFFAEQDNWMLPALETSAHEALSAADEVRRLLGAPPTV